MCGLPWFLLSFSPHSQTPWNISLGWIEFYSRFKFLHRHRDGDGGGDSFQLQFARVKMKMRSHSVSSYYFSLIRPWPVHERLPLTAVISNCAMITIHIVTLQQTFTSATTLEHKCTLQNAFDFCWECVSAVFLICTCVYMQCARQCTAPWTANDDETLVCILSVAMHRRKRRRRGRKKLKSKREKRNSIKTHCISNEKSISCVRSVLSKHSHSLRWAKWWTEEKKTRSERQRQIERTDTAVCVCAHDKSSK